MRQRISTGTVGQKERYEAG